jgi:hypothetical protein
MSDLHTNGTANRAPTGAQDDIVERLRRCPEQFPPYSVRTDAAAEIERLRAAGDALAQVVAWWGDGTTTGDAVLAGWEEARYG